MWSPRPYTFEKTFINSSQILMAFEKRRFLLLSSDGYKWILKTDFGKGVTVLKQAMCWQVIASR